MKALSPESAEPPEPIDYPSPNHGARRGDALPDMVVLHYTAMASAEVALERLCDPAAEVSAHYLIGCDGRLWQMVPERRRAWHAGAGAWGACRDVNSRSIGIELDNAGHVPFAAGQMLVLERLLREIMARWHIRPERVLAHSDIAPGRKHDPGAKFDWCRLARQGLAVWPHGGARRASCEAGDAEALLARIGYTAEAPLEARVDAFRRRFRPGAAAGKSDAGSPLEAADLTLMADLAVQYPVDAGLPNA